MSEHTPGPWAVHDEHGFWMIANLSVEGVFVARVQKRWHNDEANARLVAAAPDLLESLIDLLPHTAVIINENHPTYQKAKAAILKATREKEKTEVRVGDWFSNEHGKTVTVLSVFDDWCMVLEEEKEEPYVLPTEFVLATFQE